MRESLQEKFEYAVEFAKSWLYDRGQLRTQIIGFTPTEQIHFTDGFAGEVERDVYLSNVRMAFAVKGIDSYLVLSEGKIQFEGGERRRVLFVMAKDRNELLAKCFYIETNGGQITLTLEPEVSDVLSGIFTELLPPPNVELPDELVKAAQNFINEHSINSSDVLPSDKSKYLH